MPLGVCLPLPHEMRRRRAVPVTTADSRIEIDIQQIHLLDARVDAILVPTFSDGIMVAGIAAEVRAAAGEAIEREVAVCAPIAVGAAVRSSPGKLKVAHVIHAPIVEQQGMRLGVENIRRATRAGLLAAAHYEIERVAIPGMGYQDGSVPRDEAARAIIDEVRAFKLTPPIAVVLADRDEEMIQAFFGEFNED